MWELFQSLFEKAVWFLKLYVIEYRYLVAFLAMLCIFIYFIYALAEYPVFPDPAGAGSYHLSGGGDRLRLRILRFSSREQGESHTYELELFWSYKKWILEGMCAFGLEILNNIVLFFPFGFILTDALRRWSVLGGSAVLPGGERLY